MKKTINWQTKPFNTLTLNELYEILQLRSEVFVVEQNCVYQDLDGKDTTAYHVLGKIDHKIVAYSRLFDAKVYFENASIGRVIVHQDYRKSNFGHQLMQQSIAQVETLFNQTSITISAQLYLQKFYESHGFIATSEVYLEDDIPHIEMKK